MAQPEQYDPLQKLFEQYAQEQPDLLAQHIENYFTKHFCLNLKENVTRSFGFSTENDLYKAGIKIGAEFSLAKNIMLVVKYFLQSKKVQSVALTLTIVLLLDVLISITPSKGKNRSLFFKKRIRPSRLFLCFLLLFSSIYGVYSSSRPNQTRSTTAWRSADVGIVAGIVYFVWNSIKEHVIAEEQKDLQISDIAKHGLKAACLNTIAFATSFFISRKFKSL